MATLLRNSVTSTAYKVTRTVIGIECDICNKVIPVRGNTDNRRYFEITTGHSDWGNDSIESMETVDVCPDCVTKYIEDYLRDCSNTAYLNLRVEIAYPSNQSVTVDRLPAKGETTRIEHDDYF